MAAAKLSDRILAGPVLRMQPDRRLVTLAREGSVPATEEIVRRYRPALVRYAASIVPAHRADDVVQDSLARALPAVASGEDDLHLRAWLYRIVRNAALNDLRDAGPPHEQLDESYDGVEQPPQALERRERVRSLVAGLQGLPAPQREALLKREMEGRSHTEIGAQMGVSAGAARQLIFRARQALREGIGSLVPLPLLRQLVESEAGGAAAAAGGGAIAVKTAVAVLATGAAVTVGVAIHRAGERHSSPSPSPTAAAPARPRDRPRTPVPSRLRRAQAEPVRAARTTATTPTERQGGEGGVALDVVGRRESRDSAEPTPPPAPSDTHSKQGDGGSAGATPTPTPEIGSDSSGDGSEGGPSGDSGSSGESSESISVESRDSSDGSVSSSSTESQPMEDP
jgi:RNA polymerase sigma factor (sigma-70 family)